jgi:hypothetical protein
VKHCGLSLNRDGSRIRWRACTKPTDQAMESAPEFIISGNNTATVNFGWSRPPLRSRGGEINVSRERNRVRDRDMRLRLTTRQGI